MELFNNLIDPLISMFPTAFGVQREDLTDLANWANPVEAEKKAKELSNEALMQKMLVKESDPLPIFLWPVLDNPPRITSKFGLRYLNVDGQRVKNWHIGVDLGAGEGANIVASEDIIIKKILKPDAKYPCRFTYDWKARTWKNTAPKGRAWTPYVKAIGKHSGAWYGLKHVKAINGLSVGKMIPAGELVCTAGNLGYSMGSHLHWEIWPDAGKVVWTKRYGNTRWPTPVDPIKWMNERVAQELIIHAR